MNMHPSVVRKSPVKRTNFPLMASKAFPVFKNVRCDRFSRNEIAVYGGSVLYGGEVMRFAHLDEAGTSRSEKFCVVGGVVSHADVQWREIDAALKGLIEEFVPHEDRRGVVLHAKDVFHGTKKFHRDKWPMEKRVALLKRIASLPAEMGLHVVIGAVEKAQLSWSDCKFGSSKFEAYSYSLAFGLCGVHIEYLMREEVEADEVATLIVEDVPNMRRYAQAGYNILKDKETPWQEKEGIKSYMPFEKIVEQPLFSKKSESSILQIADTIAFVSGRLLNGGKNVREYFDLFKDQIVSLPHQRS